MNPQAQKILEILEDGGNHCPIDWRWADGHGKRLTDINRYLAESGKTLAWAWCDFAIWTELTSTISEDDMVKVENKIVDPVAEYIQQVK